MSRIPSPRIWLLPALLLLSSLPLLAHDGPNSPGTPPEGYPNFYYDPADETVESTLFEEPLTYDGDILATEAGLWCAWLEYTPGQGDQVWVGLRHEGKWLRRTQVTDLLTGYAQPTLTAGRGETLWLTYELLTPSDQWDLVAVRLDDGQMTGQPRVVSPGRGTDINHDTAADGSGGLWIVWQSDQGGQFEIQTRHVTEQGMDETITLSDFPHGDWHPAVATGPNGRVYVVWDGYDGEQYDVFLRTLRDGTWQPTQVVAGSPAFEGRAKIVADSAGRVWIAWEEGGKNWGKTYRGISTTLVTDKVGPVHRFRWIRLAVLRDDGSIGMLDEELPMPSVRWAKLRKGKGAGLRRHVGAFYERSRLAVDDAGRLWVAYRHYYTPWLGYTHRTHIEQGWGVYARCFGADGWSKLYRFSIGQRDGLQRLAISPRGNGLAVLYTTGRTDRRKDKRPRGLVTATIEPDGEIAAKPSSKLALTPIKVHERPAEPAMPPQQEEPTVTIKGRQYHLFFGDLHRHTDLSLCRVAIDGTIDDAYRYAIDPGRLDFLGITDHARDISRGQWLSHLWWRCQKEVLRHELRSQFYPLYSYERSGGTADHNVFSLRNDRLRSYKIPRPKFWAQLGPDTFVIPHQPFRRGMWKYENNALRRLAEVYQGCRDNVIVNDIEQGLAKGNYVGFICSSDHTSTSASFACVWAPECTRESIFRALQDRRTYGATAQIQLLVRAGAHWMGERFTASHMPPLELSVVGTAPIESVTLVVDGKEVQTVHPDTVEVHLEEELELTGSHYAYFHLVQSDGNQAWSSPLYVTVRKNAD